MLLFPPFILFSIPAILLATRELRPGEPSALCRFSGDEVTFIATAVAGETGIGDELEATGLNLSLNVLD